MMNGERTRLIITPMTNEAQLATTFRTERRQFVKGSTGVADDIMCAAGRATRGLSRRRRSRRRQVCTASALSSATLSRNGSSDLMTVPKWSRTRCHSGSAILSLLPVMSLTNLRSSPTIWLEASEWMRSRKRNIQRLDEAAEQTKLTEENVVASRITRSRVHTSAARGDGLQVVF